MTIQIILIIIGAVIAQYGAFKVQKYFSDRKVKKLEDSLHESKAAIFMLEKEKQVRINEQKAGVSHRERVKSSKEKFEEIEKKIDKAHSEEEIEAIINMIDEDNNFRVRD